MTGTAVLARIEELIDRAGVAGLIEARLGTGPRPRQLCVRTLLIGMALAAADGRPAHLTRTHQALVGLSDADQDRLGVVVTWKAKAHRLTYRQVEYTFSVMAGALAKDDPDGEASELLGTLSDALLEASVLPPYKAASSSLAVDWTDQESASRPPEAGRVADAEASWGHRRGNAPGKGHELFFGYYLSAAVMVPDEAGGPVPELIRRAGLSTCSVDPVPAFVPVLERLVADGIALGDVLADSGYAHRIPAHWAEPVRALGGAIITDLHPHDRGPHGTHGGAIAANGNLYCPATPAALLCVGPLAKGADKVTIAAHDRATAEAAAYKMAPIGGPDADGYRRVGCPALAAKLRCPLRAGSLALGYDRPTVMAPPAHPPTCCEQKTFTVPGSVNAKTAQKHDYPGAAWRRSYARRSGVERAYSTVKDLASTNLGRGWCRMMGLARISVFLTIALVMRNLRITDAFEARMAEEARRARMGVGPRRRRGRREAPPSD